MDIRMIYMIPMMDITIYTDTPSRNYFGGVIFISEDLEYITDIIGIP
jgi:hypothetical protein